MHVEIASKINRIIEEKNLTELGKLEQDLVFGDATSKEVITYLSANQNLLPEDKVSFVCAMKWFIITVERGTIHSMQHPFIVQDKRDSE